MWIYGQDIGIDWEAEVVRDQKVTVAGRNTQRAIMLQFNQDRELGLRLICEVEPDGRLYCSGLPVSCK